MSDDGDDEDLKAAIALSLQNCGSMPPNTEQAVINLISESEDDEDDDLDAPLMAKAINPRSNALKLESKKVDKARQDAPGSRVSDTNAGSCPDGAFAGSITSSDSSQHKSLTDKVRHQGPGLLGLDRKQMEKERLARINNLKRASPRGKPPVEAMKRKAEMLQQGQPDMRNVKAKVSDASLPSTKPAASIISRQESNSEYSNGYRGSLEVPTRGIQYPDGIVKRTWVRGFPRDGNDIKIEEVLQKDDLELAVLSAFQIDTDWIISKLGEKTRVIWVLQAKSEAEVGRHFDLIRIDELRLCRKKTGVMMHQKSIVSASHA